MFIWNLSHFTVLIKTNKTMMVRERDNDLQFTENVFKKLLSLNIISCQTVVLWEWLHHILLHGCVIGFKAQFHIKTFKGFSALQWKCDFTLKVKKIKKRITAANLCNIRNVWQSLHKTRETRRMVTDNETGCRRCYQKEHKPPSLWRKSM